MLVVSKKESHPDFLWEMGIKLIGGNGKWGRRTCTCLHFTHSFNAYWVHITYWSHASAVKKTDNVVALVDIYHFTSQMWCSCASVVLWVVWRIWLGVPGQSPNLVKTIKMRWREGRRTVAEQNWCEQLSCSPLTSFPFECLPNFHNGLATVIRSIGNTWLHFNCFMIILGNNKD